MRSVESSLTPQTDVPLAPLTTLGVGGSARWFIRAASAGDVAAANAWCRERDVRLLVLGGGSNMFVADRGFDGLVLQVAIAGIELTGRDDAVQLRAGAGESWDRVVLMAVSRELAGLECLSGIPGSVGGTPIQNVGAYGQEVGDTIAHVTVLDRTTGDVRTLTGGECGFRYRMSRFKHEDAGRFVVCNVTFSLNGGAPTVAYPDVVAELEQRHVASPTVVDVRSAVLAIRRRKGMVLDSSDVDTRSVGSFFMNPVVTSTIHEELQASTGTRVPAFTMKGDAVKIPAAWLIERAGFGRGFQMGCAGISSKHPLALVNRGGAKAVDILALAVRIKQHVADRFGIWLRPEPAFVGFDEDDIAYLLSPGP